MSCEGYSYCHQAVSELGAVGAPTRSFTVPLAIVFELFVIAFAVGVLRSSCKKRALHITGILLGIFGVVSLTSFLFPMNPRGGRAGIYRQRAPDIHGRGHSLDVAVYGVRDFYDRQGLSHLLDCDDRYYISFWRFGNEVTKYYNISSK
jgi:hypothetical protein